jgi:peptidoglycan/xylan/chitin deacetylase (PgdA/CDA1 family)
MYEFPQCFPSVKLRPRRDFHWGFSVSASRHPWFEMTTLKRTALWLGLHGGLFRLAQFVTCRRQATILMLHRLSGNGDGHSMGMPVERFEQYIQYLTRHYRVVSLNTLIEELQQGTVRPYTVAVTVDDGHHEIFTLAAPILRKYGVPATLFVVSEFINGKLWIWTDRFRFVFNRAASSLVTFTHRGRMHVLDMRTEAARRRETERCIAHAKRIPAPEREELLEALAQACGVTIPVAPAPEYRPMTWAQLRTLATEGFEVGAHTRTHSILSHVGPGQLQDETKGCKEEIERNLGIPVRYFAYPNGRSEDYGPEVIEAVSRAGYQAAVTTVVGGNSPSTPPYELRRISPSGEDLAHFAQDVSGFELVKLRFRQRSKLTNAGAETASGSPS